MVPQNSKSVIADGALVKKNGGNNFIPPEVSDEVMSGKYVPEQVEYKKLDGLDPASLDKRVARMIPRHLAQEYCVVAVSYDKQENRLTVATHDPRNLNIIERLPLEIEYPVEWVVAPKEDILACIESLYSDAVEGLKVIEEVNRHAPPLGHRTGEIILKEEDDIGDAEPVRIVHALLQAAIQRHASDISIEPFSDVVRVKLKINGQLHDLNPPCNLGWHKGIVSYIKAAAGIDISETRRPLDGGLKVVCLRDRYDVRISTLPTIFGEMVTLRVLDPKNAQRTFSEIGLSPDNIELLNGQIKLPNGVILVTGPTGSGKTTTLYSCLSRLIGDKKIITIEDPVEYHVSGLNQVQVNEKTGLSFASVLRASLRQAPNAILIGEMRDAETASIAMRAASTGHLVFSTLHTNDAASAITRMMDMGVEKYMIADSLRAVIAQRLIRTLCNKCSRVSIPNMEVLKVLGLKPDVNSSNVREAFGCRSCCDGFSGQTGIYEILVCNGTIRERIGAGDTTSAIQKIACDNGMKTIRQDALVKAFKGITTIKEVLRVTIG